MKVKIDNKVKSFLSGIKFKICLVHLIISIDISIYHERDVCKRCLLMQILNKFSMNQDGNQKTDFLIYDENLV